MPNTSHTVQKEILPNGLVVITEPMEHVHSVSVGVWLRAGSRREPADLNGISHFIEHMVFKGTGRRTAEDIAREVDRLGGMLDAFTAKEMVCFNTRVLGEHLPKAFDILADIVLDPKFADEDIAREQSVILEEIRMTQDNPEDLVHELFTQNFWNSHALGKPILGTPETVSSFTRPTLQKWFRESYAPNCLVITAAGNLTHKHLVELVSERFSKLAPAKDGVPDPKAESAPHITLRSKRETRAGSHLPRRGRAAAHRSPSLCGVGPQQHSRRRNVLSFISEYSRAAGPGLFDFQRDEFLSRYGSALCLRWYVSRHRGAGGALCPRRISAHEGRASR